jgi:hypothetical protein
MSRCSKVITCNKTLGNDFSTSGCDGGDIAKSECPEWRLVYVMEKITHISGRKC